ncbi:GPW/gp25 family protein [Serratia odorifera]|uniref:GPW/gp25 family protein n=1 Tax=Serratia odorifera TaxID=618 RepID=UPI0013E32E5D|nr:GPW/gp25 family protein [Serratia odorifera]
MAATCNRWMFANLSESMLGALRHRIVESVAHHEPRAEQVDVVLQEDPTLRGYCTLP